MHLCSSKLHLLVPLLLPPPPDPLSSASVEVDPCTHWADHEEDEEEQVFRGRRKGGISIVRLIDVFESVVIGRGDREGCVFVSFVVGLDVKGRE